MLWCSVFIGITVYAELLLIHKYDERRGEIDRRAKVFLILLSGFLTNGVLNSNGLHNWMSRLCFCTIIGCFLTATVTDYANCLVYRFVWWIAIGAILLLWIIGEIQINLEGLWELIGFCLLQELGFSKLYGRADCHAFCVSAMLLFCLGGELWDFVMQMVYAFGILVVIQSFRKNINNRGNLKRQVAFVPYITTSLAGNLWLMTLLK